MHEIQCLNEEIEELASLLLSLESQDWDEVTAFQAWTVNDVVLHLYVSDQLGLAATISQEAFNALFGDMQRGREAGLSSAEESRLRFPSLGGHELFERWFAQAMELSKRLAARDPVEKLPWIGPPMRVSTFAVARQMETWAHGQEIYDVKDRDRTPTDRLRSIATLGVKTFKWPYTIRQLPVPATPPHIRLTAPSGEVWEWNAENADDLVTGPALDFCQVVTQVRAVADTSLQVCGATATQWMQMAQCFAGSPCDPPLPGSRRRGV